MYAYIYSNILLLIYFKDLERRNKLQGLNTERKEPGEMLASIWVRCANHYANSLWLLNKGT